MTTITIDVPKNIYDEKQNQIDTAAKQNGLNVVTNDHGGLITGRGIYAEYSFDGVGVLTVTITKKPFLITIGEIESKIKSWFGVS